MTSSQHVDISILSPIEPKLCSVRSRAKFDSTICLCVRQRDRTSLSLSGFTKQPDSEDYVHRIGRTARAETTGTAITFISDKDQRRFFTIENMIGKVVDKLPLPEALGEAPAYTPESRPKGNFDGKRRPRPGGGGGHGGGNRGGGARKGGFRKH